ncbi:MAG: hypothetical protein KKD00_04200 [Gammaproteobacteria bacterium]|nr:hypothetical protein [Gammaproteobacteria bacterium]
MLQRFKLLPDERKRLQFLQALARLKQTDDFQLLVEVLHQAQTNIDKSNRIAHSPELQWGQGHAQFLNEMLETIGSAETLSRDLRKKLESDETPSVNGF